MAVHARQQAAGDGLDGRQRVGKLVAEHADQPLPGDLFLFLQRQAHVGQQQQRVRHAVLAEDALRSSQRVDLRRTSECSGPARPAVLQGPARARCGRSSAHGLRPSSLSPCVVHQLQQVLAVEGEQRRVHHFKNARQQRRGLQRAHALLLQQVGQRVHLAGQLAQRPARLAPRARKSNRPRAATKPRWRASAAAGQASTSAAATSNQIKQQAAAEQQRRRQADPALVNKDGTPNERRQREQQAIEPRPANGRAPAPRALPFRGHIFQCADRARRGSVPAPRRPARCCRRSGEELCGSAALPLRRCSCFQTTGRGERAAMARLAGSISSPRHSSTARSTVCSSSRTLPGQGYCIICCMAAGEKPLTCLR
jgi:hypothetical protein